METARPLAHRPDQFQLEYFRTDSGREPVAEWLDDRPLGLRAKLFWLLKRLAESGFSLGPPWLTKLDDEVWEVRLKFGGTFPRVLFYQASEDVLVLLLAFSKKTNKTPRSKLQTARTRMATDWARRGSKETS